MPSLPGDLNDDRRSIADDFQRAILQQARTQSLVSMKYDAGNGAVAACDDAGSGCELTAHALPSGGGSQVTPQLGSGSV